MFPTTVHKVALLENLSKSPFTCFSVPLLQNGTVKKLCERSIYFGVDTNSLYTLLLMLGMCNMHVEIVFGMIEQKVLGIC